MAKEFFAAHFSPDGHRPIVRLATSVAYCLAALVFKAFPLPQREAGARQTLRYMGELVENGFCVLIFPEGHHTDTVEGHTMTNRELKDQVLNALDWKPRSRTPSGGARKSNRDIVVGAVAPNRSSGTSGIFGSNRARRA
jgi:hypothetical protein